MKFAPLLAALGIQLGVLASMGVLDLVCGVDVTLVRNRKTPDEQYEWRRLRDPRDDVVEIYGTPEPHGEVRALLLGGRDDPRLVTPREAACRRLLFPEREGGADPLLTRSAWARAFGLGMLLALLTPFVLRRLSAPSASRGAPGREASS